MADQLSSTQEQPTLSFSEFPSLPEPEPTPPLSDQSNWQFTALCCLALVFISTIATAFSLRYKQKKNKHPLAKANAQLLHLEQTNPPISNNAAARHCMQILCTYLAERYQETLLHLPVALVLQRRIFLRKIPQQLRDPLLLFLAECLDCAYRPKAESRPARLFFTDTRRLLQASSKIAPPR